MLDEALWVPGMTCGIIAHEAKKLPDYFTIVKRAYTHLPDALKPTTKTDTKYMYEFTENYLGEILDSAIYVSTDIRGGTVQRLHITESAYIKDRAALAAGSKQAVPKTGSISEETTANGFNEFYDEFNEALNNQNIGEYDYKPHFYPWFIEPDYSLPGTLENKSDYETWVTNYAMQEYGITITDGQLLWRRWKVKQLKSENKDIGLTGEQMFKQEYPATITEAFQSGAGNVFDTEHIDRALIPEPLTLDQVKDRPEAPALFNKNVRFWKLPEPGKNYVVGVDPSDGTGSDFGTIAVWEADATIDQPIEKVAEYKGQLRPDELGDLAVAISKFYNKAYLGVENNMLSCILHIATNTGYDNYYYTTRIDEKTLKRSRKLGWRTDGKTRDVMIDNYIKLFDEDNLKINSKITLSEMRTFVVNENGKREHAIGKFDDMLFADFIALQMRTMKPKGGRVFYKT